MAIYTITVPVNLSFDVLASSEDEATEKATALLRKAPPVTGYGAFYHSYDSPWITMGTANEANGFEGLKVTDVFGLAEEEI